MLDVTHIEGVSVGDEVVLLGCASSKNLLPAHEFADWAGAIPYEIFCGITKRVPRVYI
jgi:alanine racemase